MQLIKAAEIAFQAAAHEDPKDPGALKKVMLARDMLPPGRVQMLNWALLPPGRSFARHYHEDMTEVFLIVAGEALMVVADEQARLSAGDAVIIPAQAPHQMFNDSDTPLHYLVLGVTTEQGGQTVLMPD